MEKGWIQFPRAIRNCPFWPKARSYTDFEALVDLMCDAEFEPKQVVRGGRLITISKGGVLTMQVSLARRWDWDRKTVSKFLRLLYSLHYLRIETYRGIDKGYTLLTFENSKTFVTEDEIGFSIEVLGNSPSGHPSNPHNTKKERIRVSRKGQYIGEAGAGISEDLVLSEHVPEGVRSLRDGGDRADIEQSVIGAMVRAPELIAKIATILKPTNLSVPACAKTYECILTIRDEGKTADLLTLNEMLRSLKLSEPTAADLADWADEKASIPDAITQAEILAKVKS